MKLIMERLFIWIKGNFEEYIGYLGAKSDKKPERFSGLINSLSGRQHERDTITAKTNPLVLNTATTEKGNIEDTLHLFFMIK